MAGLIEQLLQHAGDPAHCLGDLRQQRLALVGQGQAARQATEQRQAKTSLEILDLGTDGDLRQVHFIRSAREAQVAGRGLEGAQGIER